MERVSLVTLLAESDTAERWVVDGIIPTGGLTLVCAAPKAGKSTAMRCLALAVARGDDWLGRRTTQGPVLYLCLEDKRSEVRRHYAKMSAEPGEPIEFNLAGRHRAMLWPDSYTTFVRWPPGSW